MSFKSFRKYFTTVIWKDAVWSKVIANFITWILALGGATILAYITWKNWKKIKNWFAEVAGAEYSILYVTLITLAAIVVIFLLYKLFTRKKKTKKEIIKDTLSRYNSMLSEDGSIMFRWKVHMSQYKGHPVALHIVKVCQLHNPPLKFDDYCKDPNCKNYKQRVDDYHIQNFIESCLLEEWYKLGGTIGDI